MDPEQENMRRSMIETHDAPPLQEKNSQKTILNSTDLSIIPRNVNRFTLGDAVIEHGSTLNLRSNENSNTTQSPGLYVRTQSANPNHLRKQNADMVLKQNEIDYQEMNIRSSLKSQFTQEQAKLLIRNSPVNTVFQKLAVQQDVQSASHGGRDTSLRKVEPNFLEDSNSGKHNIHPAQSATTMILQKEMIKNQDRLLISVKPLHEDRFSNNHATRQQRTTNESKIANQSYSEEDSEEDESPYAVKQDRMSSQPVMPVSALSKVEAEQHEMKDAGTGPMFDQDDQLGVESPGFRTQTSFPPVEADTFGQGVMEGINFFNTEFFAQLSDQQKQRLIAQARSGESRDTQTLTNIAGSSSLKIDPSRIVALIAPYSKMFGERQIDRALMSNGFDANRYICLQLQDLIWIHNYLVQDIIKLKREVASGKLTTQGKREQYRRHTPNFKHLRNQNLAPAGFKSRFESKVVKQIQQERHFSNDFYQLMIQLINKGQFTIGRLQDKPIISLQKLLTRPTEKLKYVAKLIRDAQDKTKQEIIQLDNQFQTGQELYSEFLAQHQHPVAQKLAQPSQGLQTPPKRASRSTNMLRRQILNDSELIPATMTMSQALKASQNYSQCSEDQYNAFKKVAAPHHLQIVTKVTEPRPPPTSNFNQQFKTKTKAKSTSNKKKAFVNSKNGADLGVGRLHGNMESLLKVEQVKVNQQMTSTLPEQLKESLTSGIALGTQRLEQSKQVLPSEGSKELLAQTELMLTPFPEQDSVLQVVKEQQSDQQIYNQEQRDQMLKAIEQNQLSGELRTFADQQAISLFVIKNNEQQQAARLRPNKQLFVDETAFNHRKNTVVTTELKETDLQGADQSQPAKHNSGNVFGGSQTFDMAAVLLEDYNGFMQDQQLQQNRESAAIFNTYEALNKSRQQAKVSNSTDEKSPSAARIDDKSSFSTTRILQLENKAQNTLQKMQVNLYKDFNEMRKSVQSAGPVGVTGRRVKTYTGRPRDILKAKNESAGRKQSSPQQNFSQIKQNVLSVREEQFKQKQIEEAGRSHSLVVPQTSQQQKVIYINKNDLYKDMEPCENKPRWMVPTSKKIRQQSQPRQSNSSCSQRPRQTHHPYTDQNSQQDKDERMKQSSAFFYRTTRSIEAGEHSLVALQAHQNPQIESNELVIDKRNTINLQKAIDQYYDGDLDIDAKYNGDLHSMQIAQSKEEQKQLALHIEKTQAQNSLKPQSQQNPSRRSYTQHDVGQGATYTLGLSDNNPRLSSAGQNKMVSVQTVYTTKANDVSQKDNQEDFSNNNYSPHKSKLQGSKFKQSEMIGFRRVSSKEGSSKELQQVRQSQAFNEQKKERNSIIDRNSGVMTPHEYVSGQSFHGTYTIDSQDAVRRSSDQMIANNTPSKGGVRKAQNHRVTVGSLPNDGNIIASHEYDESIITHFEDALITPHDDNQAANRGGGNQSNMAQQQYSQMNNNASSEYNHQIQGNSSALMKKRSTLQLGSLDTNQINEDLTQVIAPLKHSKTSIVQNSKQNSNQPPSFKSTRRDHQQFLSPKFNRNEQDHNSIVDFGTNLLVQGEGVRQEQQLKSPAKNKHMTNTNQNRNEAGIQQNVSKDYQQILNSKHMTEENNPNNNSAQKRNVEFVTLTRAEQFDQQNAQQDQAVGVTSINIPLEAKVQHFVSDAVDPTSTAKFTATGGFADQTNIYNNMVSQFNKQDQGDNMGQTYNQNLVATRGESQSMQVLNSATVIKQEDQESRGGETNNPNYYLSLKNQAASAASRQNQMAIHRKSAAPIISNNEPSPLIKGNWQSDSLVITSQKDQNHGPQSVVMSIISASRKQLNIKDSVEDNLGEDDCEMQSVHEESLHGDLSPDRDQGQFLATAIYQKDGSELVFQQDFSGVMESRSRSVTETGTRPNNIAKAQQPSPLKQSKLLALNRLKAGQNNNNKSSHLETSNRDHSGSLNSREITSNNKRSNPINSQQNDSSAQQRAQHPKHLRPNTSAIVKGFQGSQFSKPITFNLDDQDQEIQTGGIRTVEKKSYRLSSRHSAILHQDDTKDHQMIIRSSKYSPKRQLTVSERIRPSHRTTSQRGAEKSKDRLINNDGGTLDDELMRADETLEVNKSNKEEQQISDDQNMNGVQRGDDQLGIKFINTKRLDTESFGNEKRGQEGGNDSGIGKEFNLIESDLNDEDYATELPVVVATDLSLGKSPIRIQTTTFNKTPIATCSSVKQKTEDNGNKADTNQIDSSVTEQSIIAIGEAAYTNKNDDQRPQQTRKPPQISRQGTSASQRETLKTSQIVMGPQEFGTMQKVGKYLADKLLLSKGGEGGSQSVKQQQTMAAKVQQKNNDNYQDVVSPYMQYLNNQEGDHTNTDSLGGDPNYSSQVLNIKKIPTHDSEPSVKTIAHQRSNDSVVSLNSRRPTTSMHQFNSISREISRTRQDQRQQQLLKRNISMNRRKSQLLLKGQLEKSRRLQDNKSITSATAAYQSSASQQAIISESRLLTRPQTVVTNHLAASTNMTTTVGQDTSHYTNAINNNSSQSASGGIQMRMIYSRKLQRSSLQQQHQAQDYYQNNSFSQEMIVVDTAKKEVNERTSTRVLDKATTESSKDHFSTSKPTTTAVVIMNQTDGLAIAHNRTNTKALIQNGDASPALSAKNVIMSNSSSTKHHVERARIEVPFIDQTQVVMTSNSQRKEQNQTTGRVSLNKSGSSMAAIREVQQLLQHNAERSSQDHMSLMDASYNMSKQMMINAALTGQPAQGVGREIQLKREKIKQIYKTGLKRPSQQQSRYNTNRQKSAAGPRGGMPVNKNLIMHDRQRTSSALGPAKTIADYNVMNSAFSVTGSKISAQDPINIRRKTQNRTGFSSVVNPVQKLEIRPATNHQ